MRFKTKRSRRRQIQIARIRLQRKLMAKMTRLILMRTT